MGLCASLLSSGMVSKMLIATNLCLFCFMHFKEGDGVVVNLIISLMDDTI
jgi:hypothetical protein